MSAGIIPTSTAEASRNNLEVNRLLFHWNARKKCRLHAERVIVSTYEMGAIDTFEPNTLRFTPPSALQYGSDHGDTFWQNLFARQLHQYVATKLQNTDKDTDGRLQLDFRTRPELQMDAYWSYDTAPSPMPLSHASGLSPSSFVRFINTEARIDQVSDIFADYKTTADTGHESSSSSSRFTIGGQYRPLHEVNLPFCAPSYPGTWPMMQPNKSHSGMLEQTDILAFDPPHANSWPMHFADMHLKPPEDVILPLLDPLQPKMSDLVEEEERRTHHQEDGERALTREEQAALPREYYAFESSGGWCVRKCFPGEEQLEPDDEHVSPLLKICPATYIIPDTIELNTTLSRALPAHVKIVHHRGKTMGLSTKRFKDGPSNEDIEVAVPFAVYVCSEIDRITAIIEAVLPPQYLYIKEITSDDGVVLRQRTFFNPFPF